MQDGGQRNSQSRDMGQRIEVCRACAVAHPQPFLTCGFETGVVSFALCTQGVCSLETEAATVNGKSVVIGNGFIFRAAPVFPPVIPVLVVAGDVYKRQPLSMRPHPRSFRQSSERP